jgi:small subunit ribosomal protein S17
MAERTERKVRQGIVVSDAREKTITVEMEDSVRHPKYGKVVRRTKRFHAHDATNDANIGDTVRIVETRPVSKTVRWRLLEVIERAR